MVPPLKPSGKKGSNAEILQQIKQLDDSMKRSKLTLFKLPDGSEFEMTSSWLDRQAKGDLFTEEDWRVFGGLLIEKQFEGFGIDYGSVSIEDLPSQLKLCEKRYRLVQRFTSHTSKQRTWCIQALHGSSNEVKPYAVREIHGYLHYPSVAIAESYLGIEAWQITTPIITETALTSDAHQTFEDAILFDMLLDLAIGECEPHTRQVEDGPSIQLQILQALEKLQEEQERAAGIKLEKRKLTIQERLDKKKTKARMTGEPSEGPWQ